MPREFFYSINLLIKSESHLEKAVGSITADENYFKENVQLILIDSLCNEQTLKLCTEYNKKYPENIYFVDAAGQSEAQAYNDARSLCTGSYIVYTDNYGEYSKKTFSTLQNKTLKTGRIPVLAIQPVISPSGEEPRPYVEGLKNGIVKLKETPDRLVLMLGCYFLHRRVAMQLSFDEGLAFQSDLKFITEALLHTYSYIFSTSHYYTTTLPSDHEPFRYDPQYSRLFYTQTINDLVIPMMINYPGSVLAQNVMVYAIAMRFALNSDERFKHVIIGSFIDEFFDKVSEVLKYIDDAVILNKAIYRLCDLDEEMSFRLLRLKYKQPELRPDIDLVLPKESAEKSYLNSAGRLEKRTLSGEMVAHYKKAVVGTSKEITADITAINYDSSGLYIDARLNGCSFLESNEFSVFVTVNGERTSVLKSDVYTLRKFFDIPFLKRYSFRFFVPVSSGKKIDMVYLTVKYRNLSFRIGMTFNGTFSRLSTAVKSSYWTFLDRVLTYDRKSQSLVIRRSTSTLLRMCESKFMSDAGAFVSLSESLYYRQLRKNVQSMLAEKADAKYLMFYDETGINGNGSVLFRYIAKRKQNEKVSVFFCARRWTEEYDHLNGEEYGSVLEIGSKKAKQYALCADIIFASDCDVYESLQFSKKDLLMLKDLFRANIVSVKNFFITYASAQFDNRIRDNTQLFFCASQKEKEHILKSVYDYDPSMVRVTGYPSLDRLIDEKERLILLSPGDRRQFCIYENSDYYKFSESRFFRAYNALLSDQRLRDALEKYGYHLGVLMPYSVEKFIKLFQTGDRISFYSYYDTDQNELVKKASLLITDFSDLQYRFAYLDKPVAYYFPPGLPVPQEFKNEGLSKNSFGRMFFDQDKLTEYLAKEMADAFPQPEAYSKMTSEFFTYKDKHNCQRVFQDIKNTFLSDVY